MLPHLKFPPGEQKKFVKNVFERSHLDAKDLGRVANVSPRTIRDWKRERYCISEEACKIFCQKFYIPEPENESKLIKDWQMMKIKNSYIGGIASYRKYGSPATPEGCKKGGIKGLAKIRELGLVIPVRTFKLPFYSNDLAEFVGIMLGDGNIGKLQISITLNSILDADYSKYISGLCNKLFGCYPKIIKKKNCNALSIYYNGVNLVRFLTSIGMLIGDKVKQQVDIPSWIKINSDFSIACLRGLIDTDGCISINKYKVNGKEYFYRKLVFANRSIPLINFVCSELRKLGWSAKIANKLETKYVWLYNYHHTAEYLEYIGTHNLRIKAEGGVR